MFLLPRAKAKTIFSAASPAMCPILNSFNNSSIDWMGVIILTSYLVPNFIFNARVRCKIKSWKCWDAGKIRKLRRLWRPDRPFRRRVETQWISEMVIASSKHMHIKLQVLLVSQYFCWIKIINKRTKTIMRWISSEIYSEQNVTQMRNEKICQLKTV